MSKNKPDEVRAQLEVFSKHLTPAQLDSIIGIKCDKSWSMGELRRHTAMREKQNGWVLSSGLPTSAVLEEHVKALLNRISPFVKNFRSLLNKADVVFSCIVYMYSGQTPVLNFDKDTVAVLHELGASLDIDLFNLSSIGTETE